MSAGPTTPTGTGARTGSPFGNIEVRGARENNLKNISLDIPRPKITVFTGISGSGRSSLVFDTIAAESQRLINETFSTFVQNFLPRYGQPDADALHNLSTAIIVDQQRLGGNPRSTLGTATDVYTMFRVLFARIGAPRVPHALALSFNDPRGMCPECEGLARVSKIDIDALVDENRSLAGERQRLKLAEELGKPSDIVILDEPTTGLHMADVAGLVGLLDRMVDNGSTVIVIEHNLDVLARADWVLDMGPGAGNEGGRIVFEGVPARLVNHPASLTGQHLAKRVA